MFAFPIALPPGVAQAVSPTIYRACSPRLPQLVSRQRWSRSRNARLRRGRLPVPRKRIHEIRDPIHVFVHLDSEDRRVLDSGPVQRLRHIRQLAMTYFVYPGATHSRLEHSLGVMHVAGRIFDVVTSAPTRHDVVRDLLDEYVPDDLQRAYWRKALILAALCHDIGHVPFSHGLEELLPEGVNHETITKELILDSELRDIWPHALGPAGINPEHVVKIALGEESASKAFPTPVTFSPWERVLSEIVVGDIFGSDRIDYLLRDSHHAGVAYGRFDHHRLIETLRLLPERPNSDVVVLGVQGGGIHSAEALLLARHFMFSQVYFHPVRQIYDEHMKDFLRARYQRGVLYQQHQNYTDNQILSDLQLAAFEAGALGHEHARRILRREHFRVLYRRDPIDARVNPMAIEQVAAASRERYGSENVRYIPTQRSASGPIGFPVEIDGEVQAAESNSDVLIQIPTLYANFVYIAPELLDEAKKWLAKDKSKVIEV
jgi:HD superfamily phosphohydrolase